MNYKTLAQLMTINPKEMLAQEQEMHYHGDKVDQRILLRNTYDTRVWD